MLAKILRYGLASFVLVSAFSSCTKTEAESRSALLVVTGNVHSQLDPCG
ncbi:MAG: hypothetical protein ACE5HZ_07380 [Fidelibacterota bacterium]